MKRIVSLLLTLTVILTLAACGAPASEPQTSAPEQTEEPVRSETPPADEYERAVWYGFIPDELSKADPDSTVITWAQYCELLGRMIKLHDESEYPAWAEMTKGAPDTEMKRDGAMVSLLFAAKAMGYAVFNTEYPAAWSEYPVFDHVTWDYPVFDWDTPVDLGDGCVDQNHIGPSYDFCLRRVSAESGKALLEFDENNDLRLDQPLTLREAALSATRLFESKSMQTLEPVYVPVEEIGAFTLSEELKAKALAMPAAVRDDLPDWNGIHTKVEDIEYIEYRNFYTEDDVKRIADMGCFNFIGLGYEHWWYTKEENGALFVDEAVMKNIDDFVSWCIERGIHVCFNTCSIPGFLVQAAEGYPDDILENPDHYRQAVELCAMLARRYADVPANALSFFLVGEPSQGYFTQESYAKLIGDLTAAMREYDAEKLIFTSGLVEWTDQFYTHPVDGIGADGTVQAFNAYLNSQMYWYWPNVFVNGDVNCDDPAPLTLLGDFDAGTEMTLWIRNIDDAADIQTDDLYLVVSCGGSEVLRYDCGALSQSEVMDCYNGLPVKLTLPADAEFIEISAQSSQKDGCRNVNLVCISLAEPSDTEHTYAVPVINGQTFWKYETGLYDVTNIWCAQIPAYLFPQYAPSTVTVHDDGTYENPDQAFCFNDETLRSYVSTWAEHNAAEGTAAWCCEWGVPFSLPAPARVGFVRAFLTACREQGVPACMYWGRLGNWGPAVHESALATGRLALPEDWEQQGYAYVDGYYYDKASMDVMREFVD